MLLTLALGKLEQDKQGEWNDTLKGSDRHISTRDGYLGSWPFYKSAKSWHPVLVWKATELSWCSFCPQRSLASTRYKTIIESWDFSYRSKPGHKCFCDFRSDLSVFQFSFMWLCVEKRHKALWCSLQKPSPAPATATCCTQHSDDPWNVKILSPHQKEPAARVFTKYYLPWRKIFSCFSHP